jgi:hypothetical protein
MSLNMFRALSRPSLGAYNDISSLWFYRWSVAVAALLVVVWPTTTNNAALCTEFVIIITIKLICIIFNTGPQTYVRTHKHTAVVVDLCAPRTHSSYFLCTPVGQYSSVVMATR